jgi:hypothetical protein
VGPRQRDDAGLVDAVPDESWNTTPHERFAPFAKQVRHVAGVRGVYAEGIATRRIDFARKYEQYTASLERADLRAGLVQQHETLLGAIDGLSPADLAAWSMDFFGQPLDLATRSSSTRPSTTASGVCTPPWLDSTRRGSGDSTGIYDLAPMTALNEAWLDLRELHAAIEVRREALGLSWSRLSAAGLCVSPGTIARFARDTMPTEADGVMGALDWLGLPPETFVRPRQVRLDLPGKLWNLIRTHSELAPENAAEIQAGLTASWESLKSGAPQAGINRAAPASEPPDFAPGVTRVDAIALHAALDARRKERGLDWKGVGGEVGFPFPGMFADRPRPEATTDRGRQGLGCRQEAHQFTAMAHWLGVPASTFLRRLRGRPTPSTDLTTQLACAIQSHAGIDAEKMANLHQAVLEALSQGVTSSGTNGA